MSVIKLQWILSHLVEHHFHVAELAERWTELSRVLDESRSFFRVHTGYFSNIPKCIKAEFIASWACSQSSVVSSSKPPYMLHYDLARFPTFNFESEHPVEVVRVLPPVFHHLLRGFVAKRIFRVPQCHSASVTSPGLEQFSS
ncbi:hypothetical protein TNCV_4162201 [Trichonephila clavipes]|nr:hypothetical protein TNCV_4162201 [Trichonephila clavipes]